MAIAEQRRRAFAMTPLRALALIVACTSLISAYLLVQSGPPDSAWHGRTIVSILLWIAPIALLAYMSLVLRRLRACTHHLKAGLSFERLIGAISTGFINLPQDRFDDGIEDALRRLAEYAAVDRADIVVSGTDSSRMERSYGWRRHGVEIAADQPKDLLSLTAAWSVDGHETHGCIHVPRVAALPAGAEKARLEEIGIRSWLSVPIGPAGERIGFVVLATTSKDAHWCDDDVTRLRTASEIFAHALARRRSECERETLEARLGHAQRLEALGTLASGISHEFNNILGAILGYGEMARAALRQNSRAQRYVDQIMTAGKRAQGVVDQIRVLSRRRPREHRPVRARPVIEEAIELLRVSLPSTLAVEVHAHADDAMVLSDPTDLQQVVINLCTSAAQVMEGRGIIVVDLSTLHVSSRLALSHGSLPAGRYLRLRVGSAEHGIETATAGRRFDAPFATKTVGSGTGLGLTAVHAIMMQQGGGLNIEGRAGEGTTFEAYLPQVEACADQHQTPELQIPRGHGETILLVDDERPLVLRGEEMLAAIGYEPVGFDTGVAALAAFRAEPDRFDLVLADEIMPEMSGTDLATAVHAVRPELPIILMTGHAASIRSRRRQAAGIRDAVQKPLLSAAISLCLARHLPVRKDLPEATR